MKKFEYLISSVAQRHGLSAVFSDFVSLVVCAFSQGRMEEQYLEIMRRYEKPEAYTLSEALAALVIEMTGPAGKGFIDVLGEFYMNHISHGHNGQFFSPENVCDLMANITHNGKFRERMLDPACGSGRMLMSFAKINRFATFYGADNDVNCAKMAVINLCLNSMFGEIAWMNSLTNQFYAAWEIAPTVKGVPHIRQITKQESFIHRKLSEEKQKIVQVPEQKSFQF
ncbi:MAG: N-6 DNA methylase [Bacteroidota bacterium]